jgi:glycerol-3-phosphate dehydrogenase
VGGKWTSFRAFSEQATDRALAFLGLARKTDTRSLPIGAGKDAALLKTDSHYTRSEIARMANREKIVHLDDLLLRRTLLAYLGQLTRPLVDDLADALAEALGWNALQKRNEVARTLEILKDRHQVILG